MFGRPIEIGGLHQRASYGQSGLPILLGSICLSTTVLRQLLFVAAQSEQSLGCGRGSRAVDRLEAIPRIGYLFRIVTQLAQSWGTGIPKWDPIERGRCDIEVARCPGSPVHRLPKGIVNSV